MNFTLFAMITLLELGAVFWVGAQFWQLFVLQPVAEDANQETRSITRLAQQRFERLFSAGTLLILLLANIGSLLAQRLSFNLDSLVKLATTGSSGTYWFLLEAILLLAFFIALYQLFTQERRPQPVSTVLAWVNLLLGLALFLVLSLSSQTTYAASNLVVFAVPINWLYLLVAALWIGGLMYIATSFLPILQRPALQERARSLVTILPYFTPWAIAGIVILVVTGLLSAALHFYSPSQLFTTAYGRTLLVDTLLVIILLLLSVFYISFLLPRLKKETGKYTYAVERRQAIEATVPEAETMTKEPATRMKQVQPTTNNGELITQEKRRVGVLSHQVKLREERVEKRTQQLSGVLRWGALVGIGVMICAGLLNVLSGTLTPTTGLQPNERPGPFKATAQTTDSKFTVKLTVSPNTFGTNTFTVAVVDKSTGQPATNVKVTLFTNMLDMDMGTDTIPLQPNGTGSFSAPGELSMAGNWDIRIQVRTPDNAPHTTDVHMYTPF